MSTQGDKRRLSAGLTDTDNVIAEFWAGNPGTELPPGHWMLLAHFCARRDNHDTDRDVKLFFVLANALFDAGITAWESKRHYDYVRPITAIRHIYAGRRIQAWGGPHQGTVEIDGSSWRPYLSTPPFPEHVSGHSTFSAAAAESLRLFTGNDRLGARVLVPAGSSGIEPGTTPAEDVHPGLGHLLGGGRPGRVVPPPRWHPLRERRPRERILGRQVAATVWARSLRYFAGLR